MRDRLFRAGQVACALTLSAAFVLSLISVIRDPQVSVPFKGLIAALIVLASVRPAAAVVALAALLPLALALQNTIGDPPLAGAITEALVFAFVAGAALRLTVPRRGTRDWLGRPALVLSTIVAAWAVVDLVGAQAADPSRDVAAEIWRHVSAQLPLGPGTFDDLHASVSWLAVIMCAVFVERALRQAPTVRPAAVRIFLVGGAAAASFAAMRVAILLIEGQIAPSRLEILTRVLEQYRISSLHPDPNAAGSYFALLLMPALLISVWQRRLAIGVGVVPLVALALLLTKSRAAMLAVGVVLGALAIVTLVRARRYAHVAVVLGLLLAAGMAAAILTARSNASLGGAAMIRYQMTLVALDITRDHPAFGVGVGRYVAATRRYLRAYPVLRQWRPRGENAHNNFLQILAELGVPALAAFLWLLVPVAVGWRLRRGPPPVSETAVYASAMAAGLTAFLVSACFGHPLLILHVAAAFFLALGLMASLLPSPSGPGWTGRAVASVAVLCLVATLPWRAAQARARAVDIGDVGRASGAVRVAKARLELQSATARIRARAGTLVLVGIDLEAFGGQNNMWRRQPPADTICRRIGLDNGVNRGA